MNMESLRAIAVVFFLLAPILLAVALAVRFAGNSRPLNFVDYRKVADAAALHRWAGNRLAMLPLAAVACGVLALLKPESALPLMALFAVGVLGLASWIALGAERFQSGVLRRASGDGPHAGAVRGPPAPRDDRDTDKAGGA
ncbi:MAG: hypothetical protein M3Q40_05580 [Pseudomonadota bacterium]|nr:hypothetical protein [Pseudomonadota bacterium]